MNLFGLAADLRHAMAVYRGTPVASAIAVAMLAVAMAFVSAFLSMWSDIALRPPAAFENNRLVTIGQSGGYTVADSSAPLTLEVVEGINRTVSSLRYAAGIAAFPQQLQHDNATVPIQAEAVTRHFSDLGPRLALGRRFDEQDHQPGAEPAVILSHRLWQEEFGGREDVLGQTVRIVQSGFDPSALTAGGTAELPTLPGQDYRIAGIMSPRMTGTFTDTTDVWLPYEQAVPVLYGEPENRPQFDLGATGSITLTSAGSEPTRMRGLAVPAPGASVETIGDELNARLAIEGQAFVAGINLTGEEISFDVIEGVVQDIGVQRETRRQVGMFLAGTLLLALIAACNISLFLLARASRRQRELGIRMAVGASIRRLARQLMSETGLLMLVASVFGVFASLWLSAALREMPFLQQAEWREVSPFDWRVLGMLSALMLVLTLLVSLAPIVGLRRMGIRASSAMVTARAGWGQRLAGTVQLAVTGIVGAVAVAFAWHLVIHATADRGFDSTDVLVVELEPRPLATGQANTLSVVIERERQREIIAGLPGIDDASFTSYTPGGAGVLPYTVVQREPGKYVEVATVYIDEHYFDILGIQLLHGENIDPTDNTQLIGNESYAISAFGRADAIGEVTRSNRTLRGVVRDVAYGHPAEPIDPIGYTAWARTSYPILLVKTTLGPAAVHQLLQQQIDAGALEIELGAIDRLSRIAGRDLRADRARTALTTGSALVVVILAALGFYGTQRYLVTAGQREYAIRSALGAGPQSLGGLVLGRGASLALPGLAFGTVLAFLVVAWLRDDFVSREVLPVSVSLAVVLVIVALIGAATVGPMLQARRTAPGTWLRLE